MNRKRWLWRVLGALVVATLPPLVWYFVGTDRDGRPREGGGVFMQAIGFFSASNVYIDNRK